MNEQTLNIVIDGNRYEITVRYRLKSQDLILFLHGLGCSKESFSKIWDDPNLSEYSLLSTDLVGFGHSAKPDRFSYSLEDHARVCESVIGRFYPKRLHIVGHSMGGAIGLALSDDLLKSSASFVSVEGNLIAEDCGYLSRSAVSVPYNTFRRGLFPNFKSQLKSEKNQHFSLDSSSALAFYRSSQSLVRWSDSGKLLERFRDLKCKKVYFYGDRNTRMKILAELYDTEKVMISKSGHFPMCDNPDEFSSKLKDFLPLSRTS